MAAHPAGGGEEELRAQLAGDPAHPARRPRVAGRGLRRPPRLAPGRPGWVVRRPPAAGPAHRPVTGGPRQAARTGQCEQPPRGWIAQELSLPGAGSLAAVTLGQGDGHGGRRRGVEGPAEALFHVCLQPGEETLPCWVARPGQLRVADCLADDGVEQLHVLTPDLGVGSPDVAFFVQFACPLCPAHIHACEGVRAVVCCGRHGYHDALLVLLAACFAVGFVSWRAFGEPRRRGDFGRRGLQDGVAFGRPQRRPGFALIFSFVVFGGHPDGFAVVEGLLEGVAGGGELSDPCRGLGWLGEGFCCRAEQFLAFGSGDRFQLGRLQRSMGRPGWRRRSSASAATASRREGSVMCSHSRYCAS